MHDDDNDKKMGWAYPPGVRPGDIPGCRPQDEEIEITITLTLGEVQELARWGVAAMCFYAASCAVAEECERLVAEPDPLEESDNLP